MPSSPVVQQLLDVPDRRRAQIVVADQRAHACGLGRQRQLARVRGRQRQRLLAIDVLAGRDRRQRHLLVQDVGRGDRDQLDRWDRPPARASRRWRARSRSGARARSAAGGVDVGHHLPAAAAGCGWNSGTTAVKASAWHSPMKPVPMIPTPISPMPRPCPYRMPCLASSITLAASALVTNPGPVG